MCVCFFCFFGLFFFHFFCPLCSLSKKPLQKEGMAGKGKVLFLFLVFVFLVIFFFCWGRCYVWQVFCLAFPLGGGRGRREGKVEGEVRIVAIFFGLCRDIDIFFYLFFCICICLVLVCFIGFFGFCFWFGVFCLYFFPAVVLYSYRSSSVREKNKNGEGGE